MAFVSEATRFNENRLNDSTPGPGEYNVEQQVRAEHNYGKSAPFGFKVGREQAVSQPGQVSPIGLNYKSSLVILNPDTKSPAFASESHRFRNSSEENPGPGAYQLPSFTDKLKSRIEEQAKSKKVKPTNKFVHGSQFSKRSTQGAESESQVNGGDQLFPDGPIDSKILASGPSRPLGKDLHLKTSSRDISMDSQWFKEYDKGVSFFELVH